MIKKLTFSFFFGNFFYGLCAVSLSIEANLQQNIQLNSFFYYLLLFFGCVVYYTQAYIGESDSVYKNNRNNWYLHHKSAIKKRQKLFTIVCILLITYLAIIYRNNLDKITFLQATGVVIIFLAGLLYYGIAFGSLFKVNLRHTGWLKPFLIGFVWATVVTVIPVLWYQVEQGVPYHFTFFNGWYFLKNLMYISLLAIMFDIKDYAADHNQQLKTFVVQLGLRKTIFNIIIPLAAIGFFFLLVFAIISHFTAWRIFINSLPFVLLIIVARSMHRRKPILYYLAIIDGLMLVKAVCGIIGVLFLG